MELLAVYGSLIPGHGGQQAAGVDLKVHGPCLIPGRLYLFSSESQPGLVYPGLVSEEGQVEGMLLQVPDLETMRRIDLFEGWDPRSHWFCGAVRRRVKLIDPELDAFTYLFPHRSRIGPLGVSWAEYCAAPDRGKPIFTS